MNIPILSVISNYIKENNTCFHMPGHKMGRGISRELLKDIEKLDVTEIPGLDNLHFPKGAIFDAQGLAAKAFGSDNTFFLVNGSTCGIHAMIMSTCKRGDKLIVGRDCHASVINGMMLSGVEPVYIKPGVDKDFAISTVVSCEEIKQALEENPDAVGVLLTRPNYYGICFDNEKVADLVHSYGKILAIDEAHGAHLRFCGKLPHSVMDKGADICVQSAHKTLPAFGQGAYLHVKGTRVDVERLKFVLRMLETSSPSYVIMTYLDIARCIMEEQGEKLILRLLESIEALKERIVSSTGLKILDCEDKEYFNDKTRLVINFKNAGITGFEVEKILRFGYNIQVEMADIFNIVCIATVSDDKESIEKLGAALEAIWKNHRKEKVLEEFCIEDINIPLMRYLPHEVFDLDATLIDIKDAVGKVSKALITPYPPGVPIVCPGEIIGGREVKLICEILDKGGNVNGVGEEGRVMVIGGEE